MNTKSLSIVLIVSSISFLTQAQVCNIHCDGLNTELASDGVRTPVVVTLFGREISLQISDTDGMAYAVIKNGDPGDEVNSKLTLSTVF